MTYKQYKYMDLFFFTIIGIVSVLFSEGLFKVFNDTRFHLSLMLLIGFIIIIRWGTIGTIPYVLALCLEILFKYEGTSNILYYILYYVVAGVSFMIPIHLVRKHKPKILKSMFSLYALFLVAFLIQSLGASIYMSISGEANLISNFRTYIASQLFNLVLSSLFIVLLYKFGNPLFNNMDEYLLKIQEEKDDLKEEK